MGENPQPFQKPTVTVPADLIQGKGFYFYMNYESFVESMAKVAGQNDREAEMMVEMGKLYDYADGYYEGNGKCSFRAEMKDKSTPLIRQMAEILERFL